MITGTDIIGGLLRADTDIIAAVPVERIKAGRLPDGIALPALLVRETTTVERQPLKRGPTSRTTDRVSVTVRAENYRDQRTIIRLVRQCCAGRTGNIGGAVRVAIRSVSTGPEVDGPANSYERTHDFKVTYDA